jgi:hypothetical protein
MTFVHGKNTELWLNGADVSGFFNIAELAADPNPAETTTFKQAWKRHIAGLAGATVALEGLYDPALEVPRESLGLDAGALLAIAPAGAAAVGDQVRILKALATAYGESSPVGGVVPFTYAVAADGAVGFGVVLKPLGAATGDANGTTHIGPIGGSANGAIAHLHVVSVSSGDTLDLKLQHSTNGTDWNDITGGAFAQASAAGAERIAIAGTINRYTRAVWDVTGTDVSISFAVALARL